MREKFFYIEPAKARELLAQTQTMKPAKRGIESFVYLIGDYAVLTTSRIKLRNVATRDDDLAWFDELIETLMRLHEQGVAAVPILGYCYEPDSENGAGYIFQPRARGEELYEDAVIKEYKRRKASYFFPSEIDPKEYILSRTSFISRVPQEHFDKFIGDMIAIMEHDILIDCNGKSNFFYHEAAGFQFIDLDSHTDYKYGLDERRCGSKELAAYAGFVPCHTALALDKKAIAKLGRRETQQFARDNMAIFEKCKAAMLRNGIPEALVSRSVKFLTLYGARFFHKL